MPLADVLTRVVPLSNPRGVPLGPVDLSKPSGARIKGFVLLHIIEELERQFGAGVVAPWFSALPAGVRVLVDRGALTSVGWLPVEVYFHVVEWAVKEKLGGDPRRAVEVGFMGAQRDIGAFFRMVLGLASPASIMSMSRRFWRSYYDRSELVLGESSKRAVQAELRGWPLDAWVAYYEVAGSLVCWVEASRGQNVRMTKLELVAPGTVAMALEWE